MKKFWHNNEDNKKKVEAYCNEMGWPVLKEKAEPADKQQKEKVVKSVHDEAIPTWPDWLPSDWNIAFLGSCLPVLTTFYPTWAAR